MPVPGEVLQHVLGYEDLARNIEIGAALGMASLAGAGLNVSLWLHRGEHGGVVYHEKVKKVLRVTNQITTGMTQSDWADHLVHHAYGDEENQAARDAWNATRPEGYPEAPIRVFRDPYSVILENEGGVTTKAQLLAANAGEDLGELAKGGLATGYRRVFFGTSPMHRKSKIEINPFLQEMYALDQQHGVTTRDHWPEHLRNVDMKEADPKAIRNKYSWLGIAALGTAEGVIFGAPTGITETSIHILGLFGIAGVINSHAHLAKGKGFIKRTKVWFGKELPELDEDNELATVILPKLTVLTMGEGNHLPHHKDAKYPYLAGSKFYKDIPGWIIYHLEKRGWAKTPGAPNGPHDRKPKVEKPIEELSPRRKAKMAKIEARRQTIIDVHRTSQRVSVA